MAGAADSVNISPTSSTSTPKTHSRHTEYLSTPPWVLWLLPSMTLNRGINVSRSLPPLGCPKVWGCVSSLLNPAAIPTPAQCAASAFKWTELHVGYLKVLVTVALKSGKNNCWLVYKDLEKFLDLSYFWPPWNMWLGKFLINIHWTELTEMHLSNLFKHVFSMF